MIKLNFTKLFISSNILLGFVLFFSFSVFAQTFTDSNLPIVSIVTDNNPITNLPLEILDDPKILATMKIIKRPDGGRNYLSDINTTTYLNYSGRIGIEIRGSTSQDLPKKAYSLTTLKADNISNNNVSILGMPSENDWILNGLAFDPSLIRDYLSYNLSRQIGNYASRTEYCEVILNGNYIGLYIMQEKIKAGSDRVNVLKIGTSDSSSLNVTGGYITKADKTTGGYPVAWTMPTYVASVDFIHELPKPEAVLPVQTTYIYDQFLQLASTSNANATSVINGYPSVIDVPSFVDFMLINELASNADAYQFSTYFHKDRNGKLRAGPIWDFNLTLGNDLFLWGFDRSHYDVWQFADGGNDGARFWTDLFNNPTYKCYLSKRWHELTLTGQPLSESSLNEFIDATIATISEASIRENLRWANIPDQAAEIANIKTFITNRINWMTTNIGPYSSCNAVQTPALVINKINYNPMISGNFPISNDQEFIEIVNAGTTTVNLTGYYFKELGFTYLFPAFSTIAPNQSIYLASNLTTFQSKYGFAAFGQFTRNLANNSEKLVLADGFGNTIDSVEYFDTAPWPTAPDGNGSYLQLISTSLDNNLASSWLASNTLETNDFNPNSSNIKAFPNPVTAIVTLQSPQIMDSIEVIDFLGKTIAKQKINETSLQFDMSLYSDGLYFIKIESGNSIQTIKVIKQ